MDAANHRDLLRLAPDDAARAKVVMLQVGGEASTCQTRGASRRPPTREMFDLLDEACAALVERVGAT